MANKLTKTSITPLPSLREDTVKAAQKVLRQIAQHPGTSRGELVKLCRMEPEIVSRSLFTLKKVNAVKVKGSYRWARYWPKPNFSF
jgi:hypothetical protein